MSDPKATLTKQLMFSPLKRFLKEHCNQCGRKCNPCSETFIACVLCDLTDTIKRNNELNRLRGAHQ